MSEISQATAKGDELIAELTKAGPFGRPPSSAPTMGRLGKVHYTHESMIELIIAQPELTQGQIASYFGYTEGWISNILASEAFQAALAKRRHEVIDPTLVASIKERFEALTIQSLKVLQHKLNQPMVSDQVALRAAELGAKALGVGGHAPAGVVPPSPDRLAELAKRLVDLQPRIQHERTLCEKDGVSVEVVQQQ